MRCHSLRVTPGPCAWHCSWLAARTSGERGLLCSVPCGYLGACTGDIVARTNRKPKPQTRVLTIADLALHEGGGGQASADGVTEAALGVQALAGAALGQRSGAQVHVLGGRLWATGGYGEEGQFR